MSRVDAAQQLALVVPEGDGVVSLPRSWGPRRPLACQDDSQAIEVGYGAAIDRLVEGKEACLMRQELADGDPFFSVVREFRPVHADAFLVVQPSAGVSDGERHRGKSLGGG